MYKTWKIFCRIWPSINYRDQGIKKEFFEKWKKQVYLKRQWFDSALQIATKICMQQKLLAFFMSTYNLAYFFPLLNFFLHTSNYGRKLCDKKMGCIFYRSSPWIFFWPESCPTPQSNLGSLFKMALATSMIFILHAG